MRRVRAALFIGLGVLWTALLALACVPIRLLPRRRRQLAGVLWCAGLLGLARVCCGIRWRVEGAERLPKGPAIIAAKHQSAWDTLIFHLLLPDPVYVLKRELLAVPMVGWYLRMAGNIPVDRSAGFRALKGMLPEAEQRLAEGAQIIVFPEGTRAAPGRARAYHPGIAALYGRSGAPVVPVALNSGLFWSRDEMIKHPGTITLEVLPEMPAGLDREAFLVLLRQRIEEATNRLVAQAGAAAAGEAPAIAGGADATAPGDRAPESADDHAR